MMNLEEGDPPSLFVASREELEAWVNQNTDNQNIDLSLGKVKLTPSILGVLEEVATTGCFR